MCSKITKSYNELSKTFNQDPIVVLKSIYEGVNVYQNFTGTTKCFDIVSGTPSDINMDSWNYQVHF